MALAVPALVVTAVLGDDGPSWARPLAAVETRLSVPLRCIGGEETDCWEAVVACDVTLLLDVPDAGNCTGRFVSFR
ncbi:MAG TPA: hypothetical protein VH332_01245 [Nitrospira sp.]